MKSKSSSLMATRKTREEWEAVRDQFTLLYSRKPLDEVMRLMKRERNFKASKRQYKERIEAWGLVKYKKRDKQVSLGIEDTASSAASSDGDTSDLSIPPTVNDTGQRRARVTKMPRVHHQHETDAQQHVSVCNDQVSTFTTTSSNPEPSRSPIPPIQGVRPNYFHGDSFDASASVPESAVLPVFADSREELETMGVTMAAQDGSSRAEHAAERLGETDAGQSFGSSNESSGTIDSTPKSAYDLVEGDSLRELYSVFIQQ